MTDVERDSRLSEELAKLLGLSPEEAVKIEPKDAEAALKDLLSKMGQTGAHVRYERKIAEGVLAVSFEVQTFPQIALAVAELRRQLEGV